MKKKARTKEEDQEEIDEDETETALVSGSIIGALSQLQDDEDAGDVPISIFPWILMTLAMLMLILIQQDPRFLLNSVSPGYQSTKPLCILP
jgi:hypothetical protein